MREIKFRAWDKKEKLMTTTFDISSQGISKLSLIGKDIKYFEDYEIMQFIGKKDRKTNDIYEGDLLIHGGDKDIIFEVFYHDEFAKFSINRIHYKNSACGCYIPSIEDDYFEIIGNIYENPELLKRHC